MWVNKSKKVQARKVANYKRDISALEAILSQMGTGSTPQEKRSYTLKKNRLARLNRDLTSYQHKLISIEQLNSKD